MRYIYLFVLLTVSFHFSLAQDVKVLNINSIKEIDKKTYERLYDEKWFDADSVVRASIYPPSGIIKKLSDEEIKLGLLAIPTSIPLGYNNVVKNYIEYFSTRRRSDISRALGLGQHYFPLFEETLHKYNVPLDVKYLPIIESSMNPFAKSWAGATGMWQFMLATGKAFGMDVNDYYDERRDPAIATEAAAKYLSKLHSIYDDWLLALAAYNAGPGNVNKAIARANGTKNFWKIRPYLPSETQEYIPKLIAVIFVMHYAETYNILPTKPSENLLATDTFKIYNKVSLKYICELSGLDSAYLHFVNPALKKGIIPQNTDGLAINIPINYVGHFEALKPFFKDDPYIKEITAVVTEPVKAKNTVYKVKSGDTLGHIANRYNVGVSQLKRWNSLSSDRLKIGQSLVIYN